MIYFDNAATGGFKPHQGVEAALTAIRFLTANPGRSGHRLSLAGASIVYETRETLKDFFGAEDAERVIFTKNCTEALNLAIFGLLDNGDHVIVSEAEHNSVLRPIHKLANEGKISYDVFSCLLKSENDIINSIKSKIKPNTKLIICNHQSNICSFAAPIDKIGELCKSFDILFAIDCAQSIGHSNIDINKSNINYLIAPAHKGLYGIQGAGFVAINSNNSLQTLIEGGNGIFSLDTTMPDFLPERHEVGTLPLPSIVGLCEGIKIVNAKGIDNIAAQERELFHHLKNGLLNINNVTVYAPEFEGNTLSFNIGKMSSERVSSLLDEQNICLRAGFHCSALAHASLQTLETGTVRASFGIFNKKSDIDKLLLAVNNICKF